VAVDLARYSACRRPTSSTVSRPSASAVLACVLGNMNRTVCGMAARGKAVRRTWVLSGVLSNARQWVAGARDLASIVWRPLPGQPFAALELPCRKGVARRGHFGRFPENSIDRDETRGHCPTPSANHPGIAVPTGDRGGQKAASIVLCGAQTGPEPERLTVNGRTTNRTNPTNHACTSSLSRLEA
jgi:hypothetical protein